MKNFNLFKSLLIMLCMVLMGGGSVKAETTSDKWTRCKQVSDVTSGGVFIIGYEATANSGVIVPMRNEVTTASTGDVLLSGTSGNNKGTIDMSSITSTTEYEIIMASSTVVDGAVTINIGGYFVGNENTKNNIKLFDYESVNTAFTPGLVAGGNDKFTLKINANASYNYLQYNSGSPRFAVYGGKQQNVVLYKKAVSSVVVSGTPTKTEYQAGEKFNTKGLDVTVNYRNGSSRIADNGVTWSVTPETLTPGLTSVKVKATSDGVESAEIEVTGLTVSAAKTLTEINVSGTPKEFWKGDAFNHDGITVTATWDDGTESDVTSESEFSTPDMSTAGTKTVEVTYKDKTTTYDVVVKTIANTEKTAYTVKEAIDLIDAGKDLDTEVYVKGIVSKVDYYNSTYKSITYWLDDNKFEVYSGRKSINEGFSGITDIEVGAKVIIYGNLKKHNSTYEFDKNNYLVEYTAPSTLELVAQQGENYYATFSLNKAVKFVDAEVYAVNVDGDALKLNAVDSKVVPANTGVLIKTTSTTTSYYEYEVEATGTISDNMLKASSVKMSASDKNYKLAYNDYNNKTGLGFYYGAADGGVFNAKEGGAYLAVPSDQTSARCFTFDDVETGINTIEIADEANTAAEVYDLAGRRVSKAQKGLYIVNGVKVIK